MLTAVFLSRWMPCPECGESVAKGSEAAHSCDPARLVEYRMFKAAPGIKRLEEDLRKWLATTEGKFIQWLAKRDVERSHEEKGKDKE